jgi:hypothetical protein
MTHSSGRIPRWLLLVVALALPTQAFAFSPSSDVGLTLGGALFTRGDIVKDGAAPAAPPVDLGPLPDGADVVGFTLNDVGVAFFVLGHTMELPGGIVAGPRQVVAYEGGAYSIEIDLDPVLAPGVAIDALGAFFSTLDVLLSFDQPTELFGLFIDDADVYGLLTGTLLLDASAEGVPDGVDVDGLSEGTGGDLLVSFDTGGSVGGIVFADEDVLRYGGQGGGWTMEVDASTLDVAWERADTDAVHFVPEPGPWAGLIAGAVGLMLLAGRRRRSSSAHEKAIRPARLSGLASGATFAVLAGSICLGVSLAAYAVDGRLEINAACANGGGCFAGDSPGLPVEITSAGSYVLTSSLEVSILNPTVDAISIEVSGVALDLNGFTISGPYVGTGDGSGGGNAIVGTGIAGSLARGAAILNGSIRQMPSGGIRLGNAFGVRVEGVTVDSVGGPGIQVGSGSLVRGNIVQGARIQGIRLNADSLARDNVVRSTTNGPDISFADDDTGLNQCADGACLRHAPIRRYSLTAASFAANEVNDACEPGYRVASFPELQEWGNFEVDPATGPIPDFGWVNPFPGSADSCAGWTSTSSGSEGRVAFPFSTASGTFSFWDTVPQPCGSPARVWCIEE